MGDWVTLNDGRKMPALAFGTWQIPNSKLKEVLPQVLDAGYRHIDTAYSYGNEEAIGEVLSDYFDLDKLKREDVFVTTKLWSTYLGRDEVKGCVEESLRRLQLDFVDLVLIHTPWGFKALEKLVSEGKVRSLGVSNFNSVQVDLINFVGTVKPVINQVECHAYLPQKELQEFCQKRGVMLQAFAPLGSRGRPENLVTEGEPVLLEEGVLRIIGEKYSKTPAQVLLRSLLQRGVVVVVKSITATRITENFQVFDFTLTAEDMQAIDQLRNNHRFFTFRHMAGSHPQYPFKIAF